ncbi:MAG: RNA polymerase sigma factor [Clostridiales Family XIII bacterium]|jgi:RNA polymerase sigma-70 factor (ECF subfamily)|nr:RNA polymerase sigma factor [Clostridiales Family XIII bacterium]
MEATREFFEELYAAHGVGVKRFIFTQARRDADATDDIFQNTWESVFRYLHTLRDGAKAKSWLYSIAKNEALRYFSRSGKRGLTGLSSLDSEDAPEPIDEVAGDFPDAIADADRLAALMGKLSGAEQQVLLLRYSYDMSLSEIAELTGANHNTVKSVARRATIKLRKYAEVES